MANGKVRDSGIELLKIFSMMIIVLFHVLQTLSSQVINEKPVYDLTVAGQGIVMTILSALMCNATIGNCIFFECSAWFLLDSNKAKKRKILNIILDVWSVSVIILAIAYITKPEIISPIEAISNLLPTTYQTNWYVTCYILFYAIHPLLNIVINNMSQLQHFRTVIAMIFIYCFLGFFASILSYAGFFGNTLILWMVLYFVIAYMKKYMSEFNSNLRANVLMLAIGMIGNYGLIFGTNIFRSVSGVFTDKMLYWNSYNNPFIIMITLSLLNIAKEVKWKNRAINYISSLTLFIYIIHENFFVRGYLRPYMWQQIYKNFGYDHIFMWIFIMTLVIFVVSTLLAILYKSTIHKLVQNISDKIYDMIRLCYCRMEKKILKLEK